MMTVFFSRDCNQAGATVGGLLATETGSIVLSDWFNQMIVHWRHRDPESEILHKIVMPRRTGVHLGIPLIMQRDGAYMVLAEDNMLSKMRRTSFALIHIPSVYADSMTMKVLVNSTLVHLTYTTGSSLSTCKMKMSSTILCCPNVYQPGPELHFCDIYGSARCELTTVPCSLYSSSWA